MRVENLLAKEGKTLHDNDWTVPPPPALVPTPTAASAAAVVDTQLIAIDRSQCQSKREKTMQARLNHLNFCCCLRHSCSHRNLMSDMTKACFHI